MLVSYYSRSKKRNVTTSFERWALSHQRTIKEIAAAMPDVHYTLQVNEASNATLCTVDRLVRYGRRDWLIPGWGRKAPAWAIDLLEAIVDGSSPRPARSRKIRRADKIQRSEVICVSLPAQRELYELVCDGFVVGYCADEPIDRRGYPECEHRWEVMYYLQPVNGGLRYVAKTLGCDSFTCRKLAEPIKVFRKPIRRRRPVQVW